MKHVVAAHGHVEPAAMLIIVHDFELRCILPEELQGSLCKDIKCITNVPRA